MIEPSNTLTRGSLTWIKCAALGVSIAVAGAFAGWNYGLGVGGWGGMIVAALGTGLLFFCLTQCTAELAAAMPEHAGFDAYVGATLGPACGFLAGICVAFGLAVGTGLALTFTAAYTQGMMGVGGWPVKLTLLSIVMLLHMRGAKDAVGFTMLVGAIAVFVLLCFSITMFPHIRASNFLTPAPGAGTLFPNGLLGVIQCVPFALFMFLGVEQAAQGAAEVNDPARSMPRALLTAIGFSFVMGLIVLVVATGVTGAEALSKADDPLLAAVQSQPAGSWQALLARVVGLGALISFLAAFFSLAYGASRQLHHLASSGALPSWLAMTNSRGAPVTALAVVAAVGAITTAYPVTSAMVLFIFLLVVTYELLLLGFLRFQRQPRNMPRPYRALGGSVSGWLGAVLGLLAALSCYQLEIRALSVALIVLAVLLSYFVWSNRRAR
ncbi:MAG: amino acid permease [Pseudomonadota bacterium]|nr:amino acid permease [Pseudomonadota bacterium]